METENKTEKKGKQTVSIGEFYKMLHKVLNYRDKGKNKRCLHRDVKNRMCG